MKINWKHHLRPLDLDDLIRLHNDRNEYPNWMVFVSLLIVVGVLGFFLYCLITGQR